LSLILIVDHFGGLVIRVCPNHKQMPREIQEIAFQDRLIPYIPADRKERS